MNNRRRWLLAALLIIAPWVLWGRQPAQTRLFCLSLRFHKATTMEGGQTYTLEITTDSSFSEINGELMPLYNTNLPTHGAYFRMTNPDFNQPITGQIAFDEPPFTDYNSNGFDDFFEVSQAVGATTQGVYHTPADDGTVEATWSRAAGSASGACLLRLTSNSFGPLLEFTHTFDLLEYTGPLDYTPGTNQITGTWKLAQTGSPSNTLAGAVTMERVATNRFNEVLLLSGSLVNSAGQVLSYDVADLSRDTVLLTNYYGIVTFADGDPTTATPDYLDWGLSIDDPNDSDGDGIPDLTDDLGAASGPRLTLTLGATRLLLSVAAAAGKSFQLERISSLSSTNWAVAASLAPTNSPQTFALPLPSSNSFWRLRSAP